MTLGDLVPGEQDEKLAVIEEMAIFLYPALIPTSAMEPPDDAARRAYHTLYAATQAGLAASRPGAACADLYHAMNRVIASFGGGDAEAGRLGHGLGMRLTEWPSLTPGDHTVLEPGMVLTLEPGLEMAPGRIMVHEENIVGRQDGPELLTRPAAPDLPVLA